MGEEDEFRRVFEQCDRDGDGCLSLAELICFCDFLSAPEPSSQLARTLIHNQWGKKLSYEELQQRLLDYFTQEQPVDTPDVLTTPDEEDMTPLTIDTPLYPHTLDIPLHSPLSPSEHYTTPLDQLPAQHLFESPANTLNHMEDSPSEHWLSPDLSRAARGETSRSETPSSKIFRKSSIKKRKNSQRGGCSRMIQNVSSASVVNLRISPENSLRPAKSSHCLRLRSTASLQQALSSVSLENKRRRFDSSGFEHRSYSRIPEVDASMSSLADESESPIESAVRRACDWLTSEADSRIEYDDTRLTEEQIKMLLQFILSDLGGYQSGDPQAVQLAEDLYNLITDSADPTNQALTPAALTHRVWEVTCRYEQEVNDSVWDDQAPLAPGDHWSASQKEPFLTSGNADGGFKSDSTRFLARFGISPSTVSELKKSRDLNQLEVIVRKAADDLMRSGLEYGSEVSVVINMMWSLIDLLKLDLQDARGEAENSRVVMRERSEYMERMHEESEAEWERKLHHSHMQLRSIQCEQENEIERLRKRHEEEMRQLQSEHKYELIRLRAQLERLDGKNCQIKEKLYVANTTLDEKNSAIARLESENSRLRYELGYIEEQMNCRIILEEEQLMQHRLETIRTLTSRPDPESNIDPLSQVSTLTTRKDDTLSMESGLSGKTRNNQEGSTIYLYMEDGSVPSDHTPAPQQPTEINTTTVRTSEDFSEEKQKISDAYARYMEELKLSTSTEENQKTICCSFFQLTKSFRRTNRQKTLQRTERKHTKSSSNQRSRTSSNIATSTTTDQPITAKLRRRTETKTAERQSETPQFSRAPFAAMESPRKRFSQVSSALLAKLQRSPAKTASYSGLEE